MKFFKRLNRGREGLATPGLLEIKFNLHTWILPFIVFLANLFLIIPFFTREKGVEELLVLVAYIFGPVFFYFYVWEITHRRLVSLFASLIYTLPTFRLSQALFFNDGAHIIALTIIPLTLVFLLRFLRKPTVKSAIVSILTITSVVLLSPFGLFNLLIFIFTLTCSEMLLGKGRIKVFLSLLVLVATAGLSAFRYHPEFVVGVFQSEQGRAIFSIVWSLIPPSFFLVPILGAFTFLIFDRRPNLQPVFLASSQFFIFFLLFFIGTHTSSIYITAPNRFLPEISLSAAFLSALILVWIVEILKTEWLEKKLKFLQKLSLNTASGFLFFILTFLLASIIFARPNFAEFSKEAWTAKIILGGGGGGGGGLSQVLGYGVTVLTGLVLGYLGLRTRISRV